MCLGKYLGFLYFYFSGYFQSYVGFSLWPKKRDFSFLFSDVFICFCYCYYYYLQSDENMHTIFSYFGELLHFSLGLKILPLFVSNQWILESRLCFVLFFKIQSLVYTIGCLCCLDLLGPYFYPFNFQGWRDRTNAFVLFSLYVLSSLLYACWCCGIMGIGMHCELQLIKTKIYPPSICLMFHGLT